MHSSANVPAGLRQLTSIKNRILALLEWERLAIEEHARAGHPKYDLHARLCEQMSEEIRDAHVEFVWLASEVDDALQHPDLACKPQERHAWCRRLSRLQEQVGQLVSGRFISS